MSLLKDYGYVRFFQIDYINHYKQKNSEIFPANEANELNNVLPNMSKPKDLGIHQVEIERELDGTFQFIVNLTENENCKLKSLPVGISKRCFTYFTVTYEKQYTFLMNYFSDKIHLLNCKASSHNS
ncbi:TPA: hypothetical protein ACNVSO_001441 [Providencia stuartii]